MKIAFRYISVNKHVHTYTFIVIIIYIQMCISSCLYFCTYIYFSLTCAHTHIYIYIYIYIYVTSVYIYIYHEYIYNMLKNNIYNLHIHIYFCLDNFNACAGECSIALSQTIGQSLQSSLIMAQEQKSTRRKEQKAPKNTSCPRAARPVSLPMPTSGFALPGDQNADAGYHFRIEISHVVWKVYSTARNKVHSKHQTLTTKNTVRILEF